MRLQAPAFWMPLSHAEAIQAQDDLTLDALCDANPEQLRRAQEQYGVESAFTDYRQMLSDIRPALVGVATRTVGRAGVIESCLNSGVHALHIEKPLCSSVAELDRLRALLGDPEIYFTLGTLRRFLPVFRMARDIVESGDLGELLEIRANFGASSLYWTHPHSVDTALFMARGRQVEKVQARLSNVDRDGDRIESDPIVDAAQLWFDDGVAAHIGRTPGNEIELSCSRGRVMVKADGWRLVVSEYRQFGFYPVERELEVPGEANAGGSQLPIAHLARCLTGDDEACSENEIVRSDALAGQQILFAIVQSHLHGTVPVSPADVDPDMIIEAKTNGAPA